MLRRMRKKRRVLWGGILLAGLCLATWMVFSRPTLMAKGKPLDYWLDALAVNHGAAPANANAVVPTEKEIGGVLGEIGPRAVPFIFRKLAENDSRLVNWYRITQPKLPAWISKRLPTPQPITFSVTIAETAINMAATNDAERVRVMLPATKNGNPAIRELALRTLAGCSRKDLPLDQRLAVYRRAVRDSDPAIEVRAIVGLEDFGPAATNAVPDLAEALHGNEIGRHSETSERLFVRECAALTLSHMGPAAAGALPALTNLMTKGDGRERMAAAEAIWQISSDATTLLPQMIADFPGLDADLKPRAVRLMAKMGPQAKAAVPMLQAELAMDGGAKALLPNQNNSSSDTANAITKALKEIDPEAAARLSRNENQ